MKVLQGHTASVTSLSVVNNGNQLVSGSVDGTIKVWDLENHELIRSIDVDQWVTSLVVTSDGKIAISASQEDDLMKIWNLETGELVTIIKNPGISRNQIYCLAMFPDGKSFVSGSRDRTIKVWDLATERLSFCENTESSVQEIAVTSNGENLIAGLSNGKIERWSLASGEKIEIKDNEETILYLTITPDDKNVVFLTADNSITVREIGSNLCKKIQSNVLGMDWAIEALAISSDSQAIVLADCSGYFKAFSLESNKRFGNCFWSILAGDVVHSLAITPDNKRVICGKDNGEIMIHPVSFSYS